MESELQKFRRRKQIEQKKEEIKTKFKTTANSWARSLYQLVLPNWNEDEEEEEEDDHDESKMNPSKDNSRGSKKGQKEDHFNEDGAVDGDNDTRIDNKWLLYLVTFLRFLAWLFMYVGFLKIGFGAVFFTVSLLAFIYWNTRQSSGKKRRKGEVSAYSVFNKDCQSIDGTLKAEHLEKQLLYRS